MSFEADLKTHYADVKRRLTPPPAKPVPIRISETTPDEVDLLRRVVGELGLRIEALERRLKAPISLPECIDLTARPTIKQIIHHTAKVGNVSVDDIVSHRRNAKAVYFRQIVMYLCKTMTYQSLPNIGRNLGWRDHSTVLHGIRKIHKQRKVDAVLDRLISEIERRLTETIEVAVSVSVEAGL